MGGDVDYVVVVCVVVKKYGEEFGVVECSGVEMLEMFLWMFGCCYFVEEVGGWGIGYEGWVLV